MRYAVARFEEHQRDTAYRIYITDCLRILDEGLYMMGGGSVDIRRFADIVGYVKKSVDGRTGNEIAADIIGRAGIEVV